LLRSAEVEESQGECSGAIDQTAKKHPAAPKDDVREGDLARDPYPIPEPQAPQWADRCAVFVALGNQAKEIADRFDSQSLQTPRNSRPDAAQGFYRLVEHAWIRLY